MLSHVPYTLANPSHANISTTAYANTLPYVGINTPTEANTLSHANFINTPVDGNTLSHANINTPAEANTLSHANFNTPVDANTANINTLAEANTLSHTNINTPVNVNADANTLSHANVGTPADGTPTSLNQKETTAKKTKKRKLDDVDLVLPDGSRRVRKKKGRPDENVPASTKRGKKKESGRK